MFFKMFNIEKCQNNTNLTWSITCNIKGPAYLDGSTRNIVELLHTWGLIEDERVCSLEN